MCLYIKDYILDPKAKRKPLIAKEDIFVYKYITFDAIDETSIMPMAYFIDNYHYHKEEFARLKRSGYSVTSGLHAKLKSNGCNTTWIIPKGSKYYIGDGNDIVSNKLIFYELTEKYKELNEYIILWKKPYKFKFLIKFINFLYS